MRNLRMTLSQFEIARQRYGLVGYLRYDITIWRTVWKLWELSDDDFDAVVVEYPDGGEAKFPVPKFVDPIIYEERVGKIQNIPRKLLED